MEKKLFELLSSTLLFLIQFFSLLQMYVKTVLYIANMRTSKIGRALFISIE